MVPLFFSPLSILSYPLLSKRGSFHLAGQLTTHSYFFLSPIHWLIYWLGTLLLDIPAHRLNAVAIPFSLMAPPVVKQRMQMYNSPYHRVTDCVRAVWQNEGAGAFYRSYTTQLTMNVPFQAIHFMTYEFLQEHFNPQRRYNPSSHVLSGACAGAVAAAATTPLDVCKTLLNTQESLALNSNLTGHITGMASAFRTVYQVGGVTAYFRGVQARVIYQIPSTAIAWSVYEFFKYLITKRQEERRAGKWSSTKWNQGSASTDALPTPAMFSVLRHVPASSGGRKAQGLLSQALGVWLTPVPATLCRHRLSFRALSKCSESHHSISDTLLPGPDDLL